MSQPMQPVIVDDSNSNRTIRFKQNAIVRYLLDRYSNMNELAIIPFTNEDREQFAQLIGYSVSGYGELSYVSNESCNKADAEAEILRSKR